MGYAVAWQSDHGRFRGYAVPAVCEVPECTKVIDRGVSYACESCGLFFCSRHLEIPEEEGEYEQLCPRCTDDEQPAYPPKPEHPLWVRHVLADDTWEQWRQENPELVRVYEQIAEENR